MTVLDWRLEALCAQADPETWFPERSGSAEPAKEVCQRCPVQAECLEWALATDERFGVWGGLSERERRELGKARQLSEAVRSAEVAAPVDAHVPGVTARGDGRWAVSLKLRLPDGRPGQYSTTITGPKSLAVAALERLRARARTNGVIIASDSPAADAEDQAGLADTGAADVDGLLSLVVVLSVLGMLVELFVGAGTWVGLSFFAGFSAAFSALHWRDVNRRHPRDFPCRSQVPDAAPAAQAPGGAR